MTKLVLSSLVGLIFLVGLFGCRDNDEAQTVVDSPDISDNLPPGCTARFWGCKVIST